MRLARARAASHPASQEVKQYLALVVTKLAENRLDARDLRVARDHFEQALRLERELVALQPDASLPLRNVMVLLIKLSDINAHFDDLKAAAAFATEARQISQSLAARYPNEEQVRQDQLVTSTKLGLVHLAREEFQPALDNLADRLRAADAVFE